jgi:hypothetical protein
MSAIHPDEVLKTLKEGARPQKQRNLDVVHEVCAELHRLGSRDFSLATVGRLSEQRNGVSKGALYNKASADFRTLIQAWAAHGGDAQPKFRGPRKPIAEEDLLHRIDDPALRALIGVLAAERNRLRAELNTLRSHANIVIDRRVLPGEVKAAQNGQTVQVLTPTEGLLPLEREALEKAISPKFLEQEGWREGQDGEIRNAKGRKLFEVGFATAIRKLISDSARQPSKRSQR